MVENLVTQPTEPLELIAQNHSEKPSYLVSPTPQAHSPDLKPASPSKLRNLGTESPPLINGLTSPVDKARQPVQVRHSKSAGWGNKRVARMTIAEIFDAYKSSPSGLALSPEFGRPRSNSGSNKMLRVAPLSIESGKELELIQV